MKSPDLSKIKTSQKIVILVLMLAIITFLTTCSDGILIYEPAKSTQSPSPTSSSSSSGNTGTTNGTTNNTGGTGGTTDTTSGTGGTTDTTGGSGGGSTETSYTVTVNLNGGTTSAPTTINSIHSGMVAPPLNPAPSWAFRTLLGYQDDNNNSFYFGVTTITRSMTVTAQWSQANLYDVSHAILGYWKKNNNTLMSDIFYIFTNDPSATQQSDYSPTTVNSYLCLVSQNAYPNGIDYTLLVPNYKVPTPNVPNGTSVYCTGIAKVTLDQITNGVASAKSTMLDATISDLLDSSYLPSTVLQYKDGYGSIMNYTKVKDLN